MANFPTKLAKLMRAHGETTRSLGSAIGVSSAAVTGWSGGAKPRPEVAKKLADYFGVSVDTLLDDDRELPTAREYTQEQRREMHDELAESPPGVRKAFLSPTSAWSHYMMMESLFDSMLRERAGKPFTPDERADFEDLMRVFGRKRAKDRASLLEAIKLAEDIGTRVLSHHLASQKNATGQKNHEDID